MRQDGLRSTQLKADFAKGWFLVAKAGGFYLLMGSGKKHCNSDKLFFLIKLRNLFIFPWPMCVRIVKLVSPLGLSRTFTRRELLSSRCSPTAF